MSVQDVAVRNTLDSTLEIFDASPGFSEWMFSQYRPYINWGTVWEIGSGVGALCPFLEKAEKLILSEYDDEFRATLQRRFGKKDNVDVLPLDLENLDTNAFSKYKIDTIISTNVMEHINNHEEAFKRITSLMHSQTTMITLVPAHPWLYTPIDEKLGHYRRYSKKELRRVLEAAGQKVDRMFYFNRASVPFWYLQGKLFGQSEIRKEDMSRVEKVLPILKLERFFPFLPFGQSVIAISSKA